MIIEDRAGGHKLVTEPPFKLGKPFVRQPRGDTRVIPEDKQRLADQPTAEIAKRRRTSTPPTTEEIRQYTGSPGTAPTRHTDANPFVDPGRGGRVE